jgi:hypothetical protein
MGGEREAPGLKWYARADRKAKIIAIRDISPRDFRGD